MCVACEGLSDLGHGPNKPPATVNGEYSASYHDGALIYPLAPRQESQDLTQESGPPVGYTPLMSDRFLVCMCLVKGCQTLVMDPTSLLQQSMGNAVPHIMMVR